MQDNSAALDPNNQNYSTVYGNDPSEGAGGFANPVVEIPNLDIQDLAPYQITVGPGGFTIGYGTTALPGSGEVKLDPVVSRFGAASGGSADSNMLNESLPPVFPNMSGEQNFWVIFSATASEIFAVADDDDLRELEDNEFAVKFAVVNFDADNEELPVNQIRTGHIEIFNGGSSTPSRHPWMVSLSFDAETGITTASILLGRIYAGLSQVDNIPVNVALGEVLDRDIIYLELDYETDQTITVRASNRDLYERVDVVDGVAIRSRYPLAEIVLPVGGATLSVVQIARNNLASVVGCFDGNRAVRTFTPV